MEKMKNEKNLTRKKRNTQMTKHEKSAIGKKRIMKRIQHEESSHEESATRKK